MSTTQMGAAPLVPSMRQAGPPEKQVPEVSLAARLPEIAAVWAWRYRWPLTPVVLGGAVLICGLRVPGSTLAPLAVMAGVLEVWRRGDWKVAGRAWLSKLEKGYAVEWLAVAALWSLLAFAAMIARPTSGVVVLLAVAFFAGTYRSGSRWAQSRMPKRVKLSMESRLYLWLWAVRVAVYGPDGVRSSKVIRSTAVEPAEGALTFYVELRSGVHVANCLTTETRNHIERLLELPVGVTNLAEDRNNSGRLKVTLAPQRHLEQSPVHWPGAIINRDGSMPICESEDGSVGSVHLHNATGVEHGVIAGTSDAGKSTTSAVVLLPGPTAGIETVWYLDGKRGTSAPYLRPACDWYAITPAWWMVAIDVAHAVMIDRQTRRGRQGLSEWVTHEETDPILTLFVDEATTVALNISPKHQEKVWDILREGRAVGVRVVQVAQDVMADGIIGGRKARDLMVGNGFMVALRPGGSMAARLTLDSKAGNVDIDLASLPPEPGFSAVLRKGQVVAVKARIRFADKVAAGRVAQAVSVRSLEGRDAEVAGELYAARWEEEPPAVGGDVGSSEVGEESDAAMLAILADGPKRLGDIAPKDKQPGDEGWHADWQWSRTTAANALTRLMTQERVMKDGDVWSLAVTRVGAEQ